MLVSCASKLCCVYIASQGREVWYECAVPSECDVRGGRYGMSVMYPVSVMSREGGMV